MSPDLPNALIVVAKRPAPGKTKTRLSPPLTPQLASQLYECFLLDTLEKMRQVQGAQKIIAYFNARRYFRHLAPDFQLIQQEGADLGARLDHALTTCLLRGFQRVVIMDSDSPTLPLAYLSQSFTILADGADVVLGPCEDGGYYLIGIKKPAPRLMREVRMSTSRVTAETMALAESQGLHLVSLPIWYDIDDVASLSRLSKEIEDVKSLEANHTRRFLEREIIQGLIKHEA
jgi:rSAM/selenodomain-associated transferase 1